MCPIDAVDVPPGGGGSPNAGDLAGLGVRSSQVVFALGAQAVVWHLTATNSATLSTIAAEGSMDGITFVTTPAGLTIVKPAEGVRLDQGGMPVEVYGPAASVPIPFRYVRLKETAGAGAITALDDTYFRLGLPG